MLEACEARKQTETDLQQTVNASYSKKRARQRVINVSIVHCVYRASLGSNNNNNLYIASFFIFDRKLGALYYYNIIA
jgi:hypothetical protein